MLMSAILRKRYGHFADEGSIVYEPSEGWWVASLPGIAGAYSQGRTRASARTNLLSALADIEAARRDGLVT